MLVCLAFDSFLVLFNINNFIHLELAEGDHEQFKGLKIDFDGTSDHMSPTYYFEFPEYYDKNKKV